MKKYHLWWGGLCESLQEFSEYGKSFEGKEEEGHVA